MIAYKFLRAGRVGPFSGVRWPDPALDGSWVRATGRWRVHGCRLEDLPEWPDAELWRVELEGDVALQAGLVLADRGRLVERVDGWDPGSAAELAAACALRARDAAITVSARGCAELARCDTPAQLAPVAAELAARDALDEPARRAAGYAADAASVALLATERPALAPSCAAEAAFIASHAAALAAGDVAAAVEERAWQARWLARRLALT